MEKDFKAENVELCQNKASIANAKYFVYDVDEQICMLHSSTEKQCDLMFGPPTPAYDAESCDGKNISFLIVIVVCVGLFLFLVLFYIMLMILFSKLELALCVCKMKCCSRSEDTQIIIEHEHPIVLQSGQQLF